jgi:adenosylcobinamide kinase / adenosylcobinamide-phosphate guanylyltransferase
MASIKLVVGGCRSGKSHYAQQLAESLPPRRLYVATCPPIDAELRQRIEAHQRARSGRGWQTVEEPLDLAGMLCRHGDCSVILVDCLTLWVNNLMYDAGRQSRELQEEDVAEQCSEMLAAAGRSAGTVIFVSNEVGLGIVPEDAATRRYRDLLGRVNQEIAAAAHTVTLMCCGIPLQVKGDSPIFARRKSGQSPRENGAVPFGASKEPR